MFCAGAARSAPGEEGISLPFFSGISVIIFTCPFKTMEAASFLLDEKSQIVFVLYHCLKKKPLSK
jgi:hypothetical protein